MKLSQFKNQLAQVERLDFVLQNGKKVPSHFHITEVGVTTKQFTDCGNTFRTDKKITFQLWSSIDLYHRLQPQKVLKIINSVEENLESDDLEIEIEYQQETVGKFGLEYWDNRFVLTNTKTDCLAKDNCGIPVEKIKIKMGEWVSKQTACCTPDSGCC
jgi:hypothetical protein